MPKSGYKYKPSVIKYAPSVRQFARAGVRAYKAYRTYQDWTKSKKSTDGVVTTGQYDKRVQYVKKKMPRYKKKAWKRFTKKVIAVQKNQLGTRTWLTNGQTSRTTDSVTDFQHYVCCWLYGNRGVDTTGELGAGDLNAIVGRELNTGPNNLKFTVYSAILDITMQNGSTATDGFIPTLEVDIYHVRFSKECNYADFNLLHLDARSKDSNLPNTPTALANRVWLNTRGATLFDMPILISMSGMKILKKTKVFIPPGNQATYQIRNPLNFTFGAQDIRETTTANCFTYPKCTEGAIIIFKPVVNLAGAGGTFVQNSRLVVGSTRKYCYVVAQDAVTRSALN